MAIRVNNRSVLLLIVSLCVLVGIFHFYEGIPAASSAKIFDKDGFNSAGVVHEATLTPQNHRKVVKLYSIHRHDRSGSAIQDMLMAHAYAFSLNMSSATNTSYVYGGACSNSHISSRLKERIATKKELLEDIGLISVLPVTYDCPTNDTEDTPVEGTPVENRIMFDNTDKKTGKRAHVEQGMKILTNEWRGYILGQVNTDDMRNMSSPHVYRIAAHVRRQDISPCLNKEKFRLRYLPNSHFLGLIDRYIEKAKTNPATANQSIQVEIYSTEMSFEPWTPFEERGYSMHLDTSLTDTWKGLMTANVTIISRSSFSIVPAILNPHGTVVFTPWYKLEPMPHWEIVDEAFMEETNKTYNSMAGPCKKKKKG